MVYDTAAAGEDVRGGRKGGGEGREERGGEGGKGRGGGEGKGGGGGREGGGGEKKEERRECGKDVSCLIMYFANQKFLGSKLSSHACQ